MKQLLHRLYDVMDKGSLRTLSLILALAVAGCIFWDPARFAAKTSTLSIWQGFWLMWAVSAGVIHGVGFHPNRLRWQIFFSPLLATSVLLLGLLHFFA